MDSRPRHKKTKMRNARIQTELTSIGHNDEAMHYRRNPDRTPVQILTDLSYNTNVVHKNTHERETLIQNEEIIAMELLHDAYNTGIESARGNQRMVETTPVTQLNHTVAAEPTDLPTEPILEYADEPLLPLAEACAPLDTILHNLSYYVQLALEETPQEPPDHLTIDESAAIRLYTIEWDRPHRSLYSMLNYTLKNENREKLRPYFRYMKLFITALVKLPCVPPLTVWRGVTKDLSQEFPPGTPVTWWAFSS
ncbi:unnamed protein product, partial [Adineta ricciae]